MSKRHRRLCPNATKTPFGDEPTALAALATIREAYGRNPIAEKVPVRAYRCECNRWHLTSSPVPYGAYA